jgi:hypothetical protein
MKLPAVLITPLLAVAIGSFTNTAAQAQRARVFVASYGSDSNPCTFGSPCKTFQHAVDVVASGGEVSAIDSAGFGPVSISKSVTITSPAGVEAGIAAASNDSNGITINAPGAPIFLHGLTLEGGGLSDTGSGIKATAFASLEISDCIVRDYAPNAGSGILIESTSAATIAISNTYVAGDFYGIYVTGTGPLAVALDHITATENTSGITLVAGSGGLYATIANSDVSHSSGAGIDVESNTTQTYATLTNVNLTDNSNAIYVGAKAQVFLSHVNDPYSPPSGGTYPSNAVFFELNNGWSVFSDGTNHIVLTGPAAPQSVSPWNYQ